MISSFRRRNSIFRRDRTTITHICEKTKLSDLLDSLLLSRLRSRFSFNESGFFTIRIEAPDKSNRPSRRLFFTYPAFDITGPQNNLVRYYDWLML